MTFTLSQQRWVADIRWLFHSADGAMGLKSNFSGMMASLEGGGHSARSSYDLDDRRLQAAERARHIRRALELTPDWARVVLGVLFRQTDDGEAALICALSTAVAEHKRSRTRRQLVDWLERTRCSSSNARRQLYVRLSMEASSVAGEALGLYAKAYNSLMPRARRAVDQPANKAEGQ
jgi:hypothetical protein